MLARAWTTAAVFVTCLVGGGALPSHPEAATFHGQVVDSETAEPLEGAAVVIVWRRYPNVPRLHGGGTIPYKVVERLSDPRGEFSADVSPGLISPAFAGREIVVFKPGYHSLRGFTSDKQAPLFDQKVVSLTKIKTLTDARKYQGGREIHVDICIGPDPSEWCVAKARIPHLIRLLAIQSMIYEARPTGLFTVEEDR